MVHSDVAATIAAIDAALTDFFDQQQQVVSAIDPLVVETTDLLRDFVLMGGKRVRPLFAWAGWLCGGGSSDLHRTGNTPKSTCLPAAIRSCASLELIQACALIHDDLIDASDLRRGRPATHRRAETIHRTRNWHGDSERFGEATAILLGDMALAWADDSMRASGLTSDQICRMQPVWAAMRTEVLCGQYLDIVNEASADDSFEAAMKVNRYKTASYTIERPLHLGAVLAGAADDVVDSLRAVGVHMGLAFQLRDDMLGVFGDPSVTGKPSGDDLRSGKRTALLARTIALTTQLDPTAADFVRQRIGRAHTEPITDADVDKLRTIITESGAVADIENRIADLTRRADDALAATRAPESALVFLRHLTDSLVARVR